MLNIYSAVFFIHNKLFNPAVQPMHSLLDYTLLGSGSQVSASKILNRFPNMGEFSENKNCDHYIN